MKKILLIEDDPFLVDIYTTKLSEEGFLVDVVNDGKNGLEKLINEKFDLLILDIVLPQIDGWDILKEIQNKKSTDKKFDNLKIIVLSNLGQKEDMERGVALGATKYLVKAHYTPSEIIKEIKEVSAI